MSRHTMIVFALMALTLKVCGASSHSHILASDGSSAPTTDFIETHHDASASKGVKRGKVLSSPLNLQEMYEAYKEIQTNYYNKTLTSREWKILNVNDGVEVAMLEHEDDPTCPYVRMKAIFPVPVQDCWDFLRVEHWNSTMPIMDPFYEGVSVHGNFSHPDLHILLCRKRLKRIFVFGKRDLVFLSVTENRPLPDGTWVSGTVSVNTTDLPRQHGYTRAFQDSVAFYKPLDRNHTELTIVCRIDLNDSMGDGGWIPMAFYVKTIGYTGAQSVLRMRNALIKRSKGLS